MPEIIGAFSSTEAWQERTNRSPKTRNGSLGGRAQKCFELAEGHLDGIEVRRILWQVAKGRPCLRNRLTYAGTFVSADIVHHDDIAPFEGRNQALLDIGQEHLCVHGALDRHRGDHFIMTQGCHEGDRLLPQGARPISSTPRGPRPQSRTILVVTAVSSINTSRAGSSIPCSRIQRRRARATSARCCSAARRLFFFEGDVVSLKKPRHRALAGPNPPLEQFRNGLLQGQIRLLGYQSQYLFGMSFQRRNAPSAGLRRATPALAPALQPSHRRTRINIKTFGRLTPRSSCFHCFNHTLSQVGRIGLRHRPPPQRRINAKESLISNPMGIPPIQIGRETL